MKMLLVATDARLAAAVRSWMGMHHTQVEWILDRADAEPALCAGRFDSMLLEARTPDLAVAELLLRVRKAGHELPLVVIGDTCTLEDRVRMLDLGADDYLLKPLHFDELAARLRVLQRRSAGPLSTPHELRHGALRLATQSRSVSKAGNHVALTEKEYSLLEALLRAKGEVLSRHRLEEIMNGRFCELASNPLEVHVHHLRRKLGAKLITTVRGIGYTLGQEA